MKSISQPIKLKLFLVLTFSCTGLVVSQTLTFGHSLGDRLASHNPKTIVAQTPRFEQPPIPPGPPPGGRVRGGATRGGACLPAKELTALTPFNEEADGVINVWAQTTLERPSWFFYVPCTKDQVDLVEFVLQDEDSNEIFKQTIALPDKPGVMRVSLPSTAPALALNKRYRWFFKINYDPQKNSPWTYVEGVIQRVNLSQATVKELETAEPLKRCAIYSQNGIWYEAIATLAQLRQKNPQDTGLQAQWENLVASIRLDDVAKEPLLLDKP
ncbi:DUF928 domain-containing protein [Nostoc sp. C117]|uniref:DUF928 domain-containing protein n=1 Tax=Nostoc sp. C117 TaxID=3349875 RepID=UPI00370D8A43